MRHYDVSGSVKKIVLRNMSKTEEKPKKLTLSEIMREADKEGLQYASYCKKHGLY